MGKSVGEGKLYCRLAQIPMHVTWRAGRERGGFRVNVKPVGFHLVDLERSGEEKVKLTNESIRARD